MAASRFQSGPDRIAGRISRTIAIACGVWPRACSTSARLPAATCSPRVFPSERLSLRSCSQARAAVSRSSTKRAEARTRFGATQCEGRAEVPGIASAFASARSASSKRLEHHRRVRVRVAAPSRATQRRRWPARARPLPSPAPMRAPCGPIRRVKNDNVVESRARNRDCSAGSAARYASHRAKPSASSPMACQILAMLASNSPPSMTSDRANAPSSAKRTSSNSVCSAATRSAARAVCSRRSHSVAKPVAQITQMAARNEIALARSGELLQRIGARRFEQPVAHRVSLRLGEHQRLIDQRRQHVEDVEFVEILAAADRDGSLERESVHEDPQPPEERALALVEQVVAPIDQGAQRLLARKDVAAAAGEHPEALVEPFAQLFWAEHLHARSRQFDRQRNAVEPAADVRHDRRIFVGEGKRIAGGRRAFDEERDRLVAQQVDRSRDALRRLCPEGAATARGTSSSPATPSP